MNQCTNTNEEPYLALQVRHLVDVLQVSFKFGTNDVDLGQNGNLRNFCRKRNQFIKTQINVVTLELTTTRFTRYVYF